MIQRLLLLGVTLAMMNACSDPPPLKLTARQRDQVDTLYKERVIPQNERLDSICAARFESEVKAAVDSIMKVRKAEENRLREKYQKQQ